MGSLRSSDNKPSFSTPYFTDEEKEFELNNLQVEIETGHVDKEMIPFLERLNQIPWILTLWSCTGHNKEVDNGYIVLRLRKRFENFFKTVQPFVSRSQRNDIAQLNFYNRVDLAGLSDGRPAFRVALRAARWDNELEFFIKLCEKS